MYICWTGRQSKPSHDCKVAAERFKGSAAFTHNQVVGWSIITVISNSAQQYLHEQDHLLNKWCGSLKQTSCFWSGKEVDPFSLVWFIYSLDLTSWSWHGDLFPLSPSLIISICVPVSLQDHPYDCGIFLMSCQISNNLWNFGSVFCRPGAQQIAPDSTEIELTNLITQSILAPSRLSRLHRQ